MDLENKILIKQTGLFFFCFLLLSQIAFASGDCHGVLWHRTRNCAGAAEYIAELRKHLPNETFEIKESGSLFLVVCVASSRVDAERKYNQYIAKYSWIELLENNCSDRSKQKTYRGKKNTQPTIKTKQKKSSASKAISTEYFQAQKAWPETVTNIVLSSTQINRIVAPPNFQVKDIILPDSDGIKAVIMGRNIFFSYLKKKNQFTGEIQVRSKPSEFYVVVDDWVYTLIAQPRPVAAATIKLVLSNDKIKQNKVIFSGLPIEEKAIKLVKIAMKAKKNSDVPDSMSLTPIGKQIKVYKNISIYLRRIIKADGEGLVLKEFIIGTGPTVKDSLNLKEKLFLVPELTNKTVGISIEELTISPNSPTRLFIIERA